MLTEQERGLPRRVRRALISNRRTLIGKRTPFGRVKVERLDTNDEDPTQDRIGYLHFTKGRADRRTTVPLLDNLISIG